MIPADLAARLRLLTEASFFETEPPVPGLQRAREIQAQLPELLPGQRFTAALQRALPDGSFQAIVAGRQITLALPHAANAGDTLELVVTQTTPRAVFAQLADPPATAGANITRPELSPAGRLISFLLTGQPAAEPAALAGGKPLLSAPPANGAALAPILRQALAQSGMFYEAHQSRWLAGKVDTASLLGEPQGQQAAARGASPQATGAPAQAQAQQAAAAGTPAQAAGARAAAAAMPAGGAERAASAAPQAEATAAGRVPAVPERILPVVHQQLDALATQQYVWHGQAWPGQHIEWRIEDPGDGEGDGSGDAREWHTSLHLTLPRLGGVDAHLYLGASGLALRMQADDPDAAQALQDGRPALESALEAIGVPLTGMVVEVPDAA
ncbi:flagellar hook-length control protein FliK [Thauera sp. CAU 1555]|uniref:Flagellar hook-length control protein FliK n=1 Tax=Thauera sedimentorum TaxID=2767595 RepID=A0ABR9B5U2_9RHOO|nr:flagellar hook-length control protein FliK [Thauera sedimentorum]MBC9070825.1 flagellar hook-length control protein FliK [Thauera sedimentorum]MBD8501744.1 flagellar hook-length control protein FliK [Thauera sedimentorum]